MSVSDAFKSDPQEEKAKKKPLSFAQADEGVGPEKQAVKRGVFIKTYGCQMNVYDSTRMSDVLHKAGYGAVQTPDEADLVILNTCHIREKATEKVFSELGRLHCIQKARAHRPLRLAVAGCVAQAEGEEIQKRAPYVSLVFGPQTYHLLPRMLQHLDKMEKAVQDGQRDVQGEVQGEAVKETQKEGGAAAQKEGIVSKSDKMTLKEAPDSQGMGRGFLAAKKKSVKPARLSCLEFPVESKFDFLPEETQDKGPVSFLTVQEGCDKFCTYCVVPYTRGCEDSRPVESVLAEATRLVKGGARELVLLGQNVSAYHGMGKGGREYGLGDLMRLLEERLHAEGLWRLRYTTSHPRDTQDDLIAAHRDLKCVMPFLHLPVQSGSDYILKTMNRQHPRQRYLETIERFREARPDIAFSSDFIVGFPGESEADFEETLDLVRKVGYAQAYSFKYSARPGTPSANWDDQVPESVKDQRLQRLQALLNAQQLAFNQTCEGRSFEVLVERKGQDGDVWVGRSPYMQSVYVDTASLGRDKEHVNVGALISVKVEQGLAHALQGKAVDVVHVGRGLSFPKAFSAVKGSGEAMDASSFSSATV